MPRRKRGDALKHGVGNISCGEWRESKLHTVVWGALRRDFRYYGDVCGGIFSLRRHGEHAQLDELVGDVAFL